MSTNTVPNGTTTLPDPKKEDPEPRRKSVVADKSAQAVLKPSIPMPKSSTKIRGVDFNEYKSRPITVQQLTSHFSTTGFQASNLGKAIEIINNMVHTSQSLPNFSINSFFVATLESRRHPPGSR